MTFVSYAQNFEDVMLWRALSDVPAGYYIDIGASHPDTDSVTRAFYDRGWSGINVEPTAAAFLRLTAARPRDVNLQLAIGKAPGRIPFYVVDGVENGLSTIDDSAAARYGEIGLRSVATTIEVDTLASICRQHAPRDIHFLKIDVEGAEKAVLEGADFETYRPWVMLLEATEPMSTRKAHADWEPLIIAAGYCFVWFDGLNRFYVAQEQHARLSRHFATPPNVFDNFLRAADTEWTRVLTRADARAEEMQARALTAETRTAIAQDTADAAQTRALSLYAQAMRTHAAAERWQGEASRLRDALTDAERRAQSLHDRAKQAEAAAVEANTWLDAMRGSTSWRVTGPMRRALRAVGRGDRPAIARGAPPLAEVRAAEPEHAADVAPPSPAPLGSVHQFHSGTLVGDAITNAMMMTRDLLRWLGYDSHIFAEHRAPGLEGEIFPLDALPQDQGYALIVRHSMGHGALPRILDLPVPKILLYHNITPPDLLADVPSLQQAAIEGREQLQALRPAVVGALADSEFNALELRKAGYRTVATCPLLFDVGRLLASARASARGPVFTVLFVGRLCRSKGQLELVAAYARFRAVYQGESRLVLLGRNNEDAYAVELFALIRSLKLDTGAIVVTGLVSDDERNQWYSAADLYVSLSRHEGFGVPLVEAMAHDVPVLAWPCGAVPYTLGGASVLLESNVPAHVASQMLALATDGPARDAIARRQRQSLERFRLGPHIETLVAALDRAGVKRPEQPATGKALAANMQITIAGHVNGSYSLAEINRSLAFALERSRPGTVRLLAVEGDVTSDLAGVPPGQLAQATALANRPEPPTSPHVVISQHYPVWVPVQRGDLTLASFYWEESLVPEATVATLNAHFDGVLASSRTGAKALIDSGVTKPVRVLGHAPSLERFRQLREERRDRLPGQTTTFLHVSSGFPRKGIDLLLAAYVGTFRGADAVRLVIKTFPNPHNTVAEQIARLRAADPGGPAIDLIDTDLDDDALLDLYRRADVMVLPTRGEGFNLPAAEALAAGMRLIVTGHGGHMDFLAKVPAGSVRLLDHQMAPAKTHLSPPFSLWAEPDPADLSAALRAAVRPRDRCLPDYPPETTPIADRLSRLATTILLTPQSDEPAIAVLTTWDVRCGIAGYARHLVDVLPGVVMILADRRTTQRDDRRVIPSWTLGDGEDLDEVACNIMRANPTAVVIQHQPGLMPWSSLPSAIGMPALHGRVLCVALHNTQHLLEVGEAERTAAVASLATVSRIVVHTICDVNRLARLGLRENVTMIPQGVPTLRSEPPPPTRDLSSSDPLLIGCYGFFLPDKGILPLLKALPRIRERFPHARLRLLNATYPAPISALEIAASKRLAAALGQEDAVDFMTDFLSDERSTELLAECDLIVLPYQRSSEASSAALRSAMAAHVPIAVTPLPLFDEAGDAVFRLPGLEPDDIAAGIVSVLADVALRRRVVAQALEWRLARAWLEVGKRWAAMLRGLAGSGIVMGGDPGPHPVR